MSLRALLFDFVFYYPLFMAYLWMAGALWYWFRYERRGAHLGNPVDLLPSLPMVSILVPCRNEADNVREVVGALSRVNYPNYEIICINDGSTDDTGKILDELLGQYPRLRVIHQRENQGKAVALNTAALLARGEFLLGIDGDSILDPNALPWMLWHFLTGPRVGAVTGNPRIRTRSTLLGRLQVGEFSSIIGLIKRAQRTYGRLFTVSGVVTMFRRHALMKVGFWNPEALTEDIDISWRLQTNQWDVRFEPRALSWILMPETLVGLWKQRLRWAIGGGQVILRYFYVFGRSRNRRMWPVFVEYVTSVVWAYSMGVLMALWLIGLFVPLPDAWKVVVVPGLPGVLIGTTCLIQVFVALLLDRYYDRRTLRQFFWMIWYPIAYWMLNMCTTIWSVPKVLRRRKGRRAIWVSPDRGLRDNEPEMQESP